MKRSAKLKSLLNTNCKSLQVRRPPNLFRKQWSNNSESTIHTTRFIIYIGYNQSIPPVTKNKHSCIPIIFKSTITTR